MHTPSTRELAERLRKEGYSYPYISKLTGLSKSTLSGWLACVPYSPNKFTVSELGRARAASGEQKARARQENIENIRQIAIKEVGAVSDRDVFVFGLGLYLGEGSKTHGITRITNSDPEVIRLAISWFQVLGLSNDHFSLTIHLYPDSDVEESLQFWSETTTLSRSQFGKVQIDKRTDKKRYKAGKLPHGTAHLTVRSRGKKEFGVELARKIHAWTQVLIDRVSEKRN